MTPLHYTDVVYWRNVDIVANLVICQELVWEILQQD